MAAFDYVPISFKNRLHLAGRPQMSTRPSTTLADFVFAGVQGFVSCSMGTFEMAVEE